MEAKKAFLVFAAIVLFVTISERLVFVLFPTYLIEKNFTATEIGAVFSAAAIAIVVLRTAIGRASDKYGRKFMFSAALLINSLSVSMYPMISKISEFAIVKSLQDVSNGIKVSVEDSIIADTFNRRLRPAYLISLGKIWPLSRTLGSAIGIVLTAYFSLAFGFYVAAFSVFVAFLIFSLFFKERKKTRIRSAKFNPIKYSKRFKFIAATAFVLSFVFSMTYAPAFFILAERYLHISASTIFFLLMVSSLLAGLSIHLVEKKIKNFGRKDILFITSILIAIFTFGYAVASELVLLGACLIVVSVAFHFWHISFRTLYMDIAHVKSRGEQIGFVKTMHGLGDIAGPVLGGFLIDFYSIQAPFVLGGILYAAMALLILKTL